MKTKRLNFEWIKTGEQYGDAASAVTCFGHSAKIHSTDKGTWTCIVDWVGVALKLRVIHFLRY